MAYYRLRCLKADHRPCFDEFEARDDVQATRKAEALAGSHPAELWCGKRFVTLFQRALSARSRARPNR